MPLLCEGISVLTLVEHPTFTKNVLKVFEDDEYRELQVELVADPKGGDVIPGLGGLRKKRWADCAKSAGLRRVKESVEVLGLFTYICLRQLSSIFFISSLRAISLI
jgi:hypothetical protein